MLLPEVIANENIQEIQLESEVPASPSLDEFVPENHEARIINDVVDTMDLSLLLAKYAGGGGAPAYHPAMNLRGLMKVRGEFLLMCLVHNVKKIVKRVIEGAVHLPGKYSKLIEEAMLGYREEDLALVGAEV
jgi:hypothetical protein